MAALSLKERPMRKPLSRLERLAGSPAFWLTLAACTITFNIARAVLSPSVKPIPVLGQISDFELTDHRDRTLTKQSLQGKTWVANFIFTRCPTVCPAFTAKMAQIQKRSRALGQDFHMVSFSVDPQHDTPEVLRIYAKEHGAKRINWSFVTGDLDEVKKTVIEGLKISMGNNDPEGNFAGIFHGSHFVLVDGRGRIRGYYDANDADAVERVLDDAGMVLNRAGQS